MTRTGSDRLIPLRNTSIARHGMGTAIGERIAQQTDAFVFLFDLFTGSDHLLWDHQTLSSSASKWNGDALLTLTVPPHTAVSQPNGILADSFSCAATINPNYPIPVPEKLPIKVEPCPIVEAIFEVRFVTPEQWTTLPGQLFPKIRGKYPNQKRLPLAELPESIRASDPQLAHQPLIQFVGQLFLIQLGPRVISLVTKSNLYPGWIDIRAELEWLFTILKEASIVSETERIGVRYIEFFEGDVFEKINLSIRVNETPVKSVETDITTIFNRNFLKTRLQISNGALVEKRAGSILDMDSWYGPLDVDLFENGLSLFDTAHKASKELFFGLLTKDALKSLNPVY